MTLPQDALLAEMAAEIERRLNNRPGDYLTAAKRALDVVQRDMIRNGWAFKPHMAAT